MTQVSSQEVKPFEPTVEMNRARWKTRRKIVIISCWLYVLAILFLLGLGLYDAPAVAHYSTLLGHISLLQGAILSAYFGFATYDHVKQSEFGSRIAMHTYPQPAHNLQEPHQHSQQFGSAEEMMMNQSNTDGRG